MIQISGAFVPVTTPFEPGTGDVDHAGMARNISRLASTDLSGFVLFGTTGEGQLVDGRERAEVLDRVRAAVPDRTMIVAAGAESTRKVVRMATAAAAAGADAVLVFPPSYYRPLLTSEVLRDYYTAVAEASPVPVVVYQIPPGYSGVDLSTDLVAGLARHPNIVGVKDSRGNLSAMTELIEASPSDFAVMVGNVAVLEGALEAGAAGAIVADANFAPDWCCDVVAASGEGDPGRQGDLRRRLTITSREIVVRFGIPGVKAALDLLGYTGGPPRAPLKSVGERDRSDIRRTLENVGLTPATAEG